MRRAVKRTPAVRPLGFGGILRAPSGRGVGVRQFAAYEGPALLMLVALIWMTVLSLIHPNSLSLTRSAELAATIASAGLLITCAATYVAIAEFLLYGSLASLCIGSAFLVFAGDNLGMQILPLLGGWKIATGWVRYGSALEQACAAGLLLLAGTTVGRVIPTRRRMRVVNIGLLFGFCIVLIVTSIVYRAASESLSQSAARNTSFIATVLFFCGSLAFWRNSRRLGRSWYFWLSLGLSFAGFAEIQYALHQHSTGTVEPGDLLEIVFFASILLALAAEWTQSYWWLRWQTQELSALHALTSAPSLNDVGSVMHHIEGVVGEALGAPTRVVMVRPDNSPQPEVEAGEYAENGHSSRQESLLDEALATANADDELSVILGVPMNTSRGQIGALIAARPREDSFSNQDIRLLRAFGPQAALVLEQSLLYDEMAAGAILQERSRLAREIHDGLAQHLAFLKMRVAWLKRLPAQVNESQLQDIEGVLETALIEARHAITTLRSVPEGISTGEAIRRYAEEFAQVSGLVVDVDSDEHIPEPGPKLRVELSRVVQEALNNVRKHARATCVKVRLCERDGGMLVTIKDDGVGFATGAGAEGHFGLEIMSERAESVGGKLEIQSQPGQGTTVSVWMPASGSSYTPADGALTVEER